MHKTYLISEFDPRAFESRVTEALDEISRDDLTVVYMQFTQMPSVGGQSNLSGKIPGGSKYSYSESISGNGNIYTTAHFSVLIVARD